MSLCNLSASERREFEAALSAWDAHCSEEERRAFLAGWEEGRRSTPLPASIREALDSGDGVYRP